MNCMICNKQIMSGTFIFVRSQKRIICRECKDGIERIGENDKQIKQNFDKAVEDAK